LGVAGHKTPQRRLRGECCNTNTGRNGNTEDKAKASLNDAELIRYFKEVDNLPAEDKSALLRIISGFIRDVKTKQAYAS
jgi:hypothetical protein